jgi:hypothetical protein
MAMNTLGLAALAACIAAVPALADDWDFVLVNGSGKEVKTVEVAATGTTSWQANKVDPDIKREPTLKPGARMTVHFDKGTGCKYDIKLGFADGTSSSWTGINVCDNSFVTVKYSATGAPVFTAN